MRRWLTIHAGAWLAVFLAYLGVGALGEIAPGLTPTEAFAGRASCYLAVVLIVAYWPRPRVPEPIPDLRQQAKRVRRRAQPEPVE